MRDRRQADPADVRDLCGVRGGYGEGRAVHDVGRCRGDRGPGTLDEVGRPEDLVVPLRRVGLAGPRHEGVAAGAAQHGAVLHH